MSNQGESLPIMTGGALTSQRLLPSSIPVRTSISAPANGPCLARVATDTAIFVKFGLPGEAPVASNDHSGTEDGRLMLMANSSEIFLVRPGAVAAIVAAA
jgi:hypothetical protein